MKCKNATSVTNIGQLCVDDLLIARMFKEVRMFTDDLREGPHGHQIKMCFVNLRETQIGNVLWTHNIMKCTRNLGSKACLH
jgi:hypothetical protein